jgi:hypothetical protein
LHEATSGVFGRKAGAARKASSIKTRSRLSSAALFEDWQNFLTLVRDQEATRSACSGQFIRPAQGQQDSGEMRMQAKSSAGAYVEIWKSLTAKGMPFAGWLLK